MAQRKFRYSGPAFSARGEKDRFVLPTTFRKTVFDSSDARQLYLSKHPTMPCLIGFGASYLDEIEKEIDREEDRALAKGEDFDRGLAALKYGAMVEPVTFDASGRFVFPKFLKDLAGIDDKAVFLGAVYNITIWNPDIFFAEDSQLDVHKDRVKALLEEAGHSA